MHGASRGSRSGAWRPRRLDARRLLHRGEFIPISAAELRSRGTRAGRKALGIVEMIDHQRMQRSHLVALPLLSPARLIAVPAFKSTCCQRSAKSEPIRQPVM